jgi:hypothetical protein
MPAEGRRDRRPCRDEPANCLRAKRSVTVNIATNSTRLQNHMPEEEGDS